TLRLLGLFLGFELQQHGSALSSELSKPAARNGLYPIRTPGSGHFVTVKKGLLRNPSRHVEVLFPLLPESVSQNALIAGRDRRRPRSPCSREQVFVQTSAFLWR